LQGSAVVVRDAVAQGRSKVVQPKRLSQILLHSEAILEHGAKIAARCSVLLLRGGGVVPGGSGSVALGAADAQPHHLREGKHAVGVAWKTFRFQREVADRDERCDD
jgi:hypothetical protein